jgi:hypothetical protein
MNALELFLLKLDESSYDWWEPVAATLELPEPPNAA